MRARVCAPDADLVMKTVNGAHASSQAGRQAGRPGCVWRSRRELHSRKRRREVLPFSEVVHLCPFSVAC